MPLHLRSTDLIAIFGGLFLAVACLIAWRRRKPEEQAEDMDYEKRIRSQLDEQDRRARRMEEQQDQAEQRGQRLDALLTKWEEQARRQDAILDHLERDHVIKK